MISFAAPARHRVAGSEIRSLLFDQLIRRAGYVDAVNDTASQALTGTAENGSTVKIYDNGGFVGSTIADASTGAWSYAIGRLAFYVLLGRRPRR